MSASIPIRVAAPLRAQVEDILRRDIAEGILAPGDKLVARELCLRFGVSRPLIREALHQLEAERLVVTEPGRGLFVAVLDATAARELYQVRGQLESLAASLCAQNGDELTLKRLETALNDLERAIIADDMESFLEGKAAFYGALIQGSGNAILEELLGLIANRIRLLRVTNLQDRRRMAPAAAELRAIFDAIRGGNAAVAQQRSLDHIAKAAAAISAALARRCPTKNHGEKT